MDGVRKPTQFYLLGRAPESNNGYSRLRKLPVFLKAQAIEPFLVLHYKKKDVVRMGERWLIKNKKTGNTVFEIITKKEITNDTDR